MWVWRTDWATSPRPIITKREMKALANQGALDCVHSQQGVQKKPGRHQPHQGKNQGKRNAENLQRPTDGGIDERLRRIVGIDQDRDAQPPCLRALKTPRPLPWPVVDVVAVAPRVQADAGAFVSLARHLIA